jgi:carbonic anhydrase/acetyltransferase-like protein (isoleucine patch superfamily)
MSEIGKKSAGGGSLYPFGGKWPLLGEGVFLAPGARVIGDVEIGAGSSIWFNCVVRGDVNAIRIGARSNIQDGSVVHVTTRTHQTHIGDDVLVGHMALIHGCTLEDGAFVGMGATVMDGCIVEGGGMVAAGALLTPGKIVKSGQLWAGRPARYVRDLTAGEIAHQDDGRRGYAKLAAEYLAAYSAS